MRALQFTPSNHATLILAFVLLGLPFSAYANVASATFVKTDTSTQGSWKGVYGGDGFNVINDTSSNNPTYPSYATVTPANYVSAVWTTSSTAANCLQKAAAGSTDRMAGVWYQTSWTMAVNVSGTHQIALYLLDIDGDGYAETITIKDATTGNVLDTESASSFASGKYYVWNVSGNVTVSFASTGGHWAVLNGIFFGTGSGSVAPPAPAGLTATRGGASAVLNWTASSGATSYNVYRGTSAGAESATAIATGVTGTTYTDTGVVVGSTYYYKVVAVNAGGGSPASNEASVTLYVASATFVKTDTSTQGSWKGVYGGDGFNVINDTSSDNPSYPSYAPVTPANYVSAVWTTSSTAANCLQKAAAGSTDRMAGVWYQTSWTMAVNVSGTHQIALYLLDIDGDGYAETITIKDATTGNILDTESASSFASGKYYVWNVSGNVTVSFASTGGHWAVLNGIFFGTGSGSVAPPAPAGLTATRGGASAVLNWTASSGATSYNVYRGTSAGAESATAIATGVTGTTYTDTGVVVGSTYYYKVVAVNAGGGSPASNEASVTLPVASATFVKTDTSTQGSWKGVYGGDGFNVINDTSSDNPSYPSYATVTPANYVSAVWTTSSTAANCLQKAAAGSTDRMAGVWYQTSWTMAVNVSGTHQIALYLLDIDGDGYAETITIKDAATGTVLDTESASSFASGKYYVWNVSGNVTVSFASTGGHWAVLNGIFLGNGSATIIPNAPADLAAVGGVNQVTLTWQPSGIATSYNVYRGLTSGGEGATAIATGITSPTYTNTSLASATTYFYEVTAVNPVGESGHSNEASALTAPAAPTSPSATPNNEQVALSWSPATGATSYNVYRSTTAGGEGSTPVANGIAGTSYTNTGLSNGALYYFKIAAVNSGGTSPLSTEVSGTPFVDNAYGGTPAAIPGTVQAENYDTGGQGVGYNITSNSGTDTTYRTDGVDLETCSDTGGGVDLGWTASGQWFAYTVNVSTAGTYTVSFRVASGQNGGSLHIENAAGTNLTGAVTVPETAGWESWFTVRANVTLPAGYQTLRLAFDTDGFNINYVTFASGASTLPPNFGPNVLVIDPTMDMASVQDVLNNIWNQQSGSQFGTDRFALLFAPGAYALDVPVGYYTQVLGLGSTPDSVTINGEVQELPELSGDNATCNFWSGVENLAVNPVDSGGTDVYAVSQANPMRRVHVEGNLALSLDGGYSSGGFLGDSLIDGQVQSGSQQQWITRNSELGSWSGGVWNMVFVGDQGSPSGGFPSYTVVGSTPVIREKPFLTVDGSGNYGVFVPSLRTNSSETTWHNATEAGATLPISSFYIAQSSVDNAATINAALNQGMNILLTPGNYALNGTIQVNNANTVILGIGLATLQANSGQNAMQIADVDGVTVAGVLFETASNVNTLLQVGPSGSSATHANPTLISDCFFRVGGAVIGTCAVSLQINSSNVIADDLWIWRADHGNGGTVGWTTNVAANGLVVNGQNVTIYGLAVEHYQQYQTLWNGNGGQTYFYESECPYDVPSESSWMAGSEQGYSSYEVANSVTTHQAWGLGVYSNFTSNNAVTLQNAIECPQVSGVQFTDMVTISLTGTISNIIDNTGNSVSSSNFESTLQSFQ